MISSCFSNKLSPNSVSIKQQQWDRWPLLQSLWASAKKDWKGVLWNHQKASSFTSGSWWYSIAGTSTGLRAFHIISSCGDTLGFHMGWQLVPESKYFKKLGESCITFYGPNLRGHYSVFSAVIVRKVTTEPRSLQVTLKLGVVGCSCGRHFRTTKLAAFSLFSYQKSQFQVCVSSSFAGTLGPMASYLISLPML